MSIASVVADVLVVGGTAVALAAGLGVELARGALARLHFVGLLAVAATPLYAIAAALASADGQATAKLVLLAVLVAAESPVIAHVTARAIRARGDGEGSGAAEDAP